MDDDSVSATSKSTDDLPAFTARHFQPLLDMLLAEDQALVSTITDTVDMADADRIAKHLFIVFEAHGHTSRLLTSTITREINNCKRSNLLFRTNSVCTKIMTVFARALGLDYLRQTIGDCVQEIAESTRSYEVDPTRAKPGMDLDDNMSALSAEVENFLQHVLSSYDICPKQFRAVCHTLQSVTLQRFPDAGHIVVAGFYFLRYLCPSIVSPPTYGLLDTFPKKESHRGLVLIAKTLQNMANGVQFGVKETHMEPLNGIMAKYEQQIKDFLIQISSGQEGGPDLAPLAISEQEKISAMYELYQHLHKNVSRIEENLASLEGINNAPHMWNMTKLIISELDRINRQLKGIDTPQSSKQKLPELIFGEAKVRVLNMEMEWRDPVRHPNMAALDLLNRARRLVEDNMTGVASVKLSIGAAPIIGSGAAAGVPLSGPVVDWHQMGDSVDFKEFVLDAAELQKVDLNQLATQKEALAFWLNVFNIMVIHIHLENGAPTSSRRRRAMFGSFVYEIAFQQFTLEDIVEGILRGNPKEHFRKKDPRAAFAMKAYDPRSHFGYSFLTQTSPPIRIFKPETLSVQLSLAAEQFLQENVSVVEDKRKIRLPYLLKQYYQDFGVHETDVFRWLARYLDQQTSQEISNLLATTHYSLEYNDQVWEPRRKIFVDDPEYHSRTSAADLHYSQFPLEAVIQRCRENSQPNTIDTLDDMGILNLEVKWTTKSHTPQDVVAKLLTHAQGLCSLFLFDWGSVAGSPEFKAFLLATAELQAISLDEIPKSEAAVFWINVYNLLMIHLYIMKRPPADMSVFGRRHFFGTYKYHIGGHEFSLDDIEHGIIRGNGYKKQIKKKDPRFRYALTPDPRVSFTLSLLTKTSPVIRVYHVDGFEASLTRAAQSFLRSQVEVNAEKAKVTLPNICKELYEHTYKKKKEDFLIWIAQFLTNDQKNLVENWLASKTKVSLQFADFDWTPWPVFDR